MDERLVAVEEPVAAGQQVALQPALAEVLGEDLQHAAGRRQVVVGRSQFGHPGTVGRLEDRVEAVRGRLIGPEHPERLRIGLDHVAQEGAEHSRRLARGRGRRGHLDPVLAEVGQVQAAQEQAAVGVRVRAHASIAPGRQRRQLRAQRTALVEQLLRPVGTHPCLEQGQMGRVAADVRDRHLVRPERAFHLLAVDFLGACPALRGPQDDHRPARPDDLPGRRLRLDRDGLVHDPIERRSELDVDGGGVVARDDVGRVPVSLEEMDQLVLADPRKDGRVGDLVPVEMEDGHDRAIDRRVEELVRVPAGGEWSRLGLPVADHAEDDQIRVVEGRTECVDQRVAELAALVDGAGRLRRDVAADPAGEGELAEQPVHPLLVGGELGVHLAGRALEVRVRPGGGPAVSGPDDPDRVEIARIDDPVRVGVDEVEPGRRPPVAKEPGLDVLGAQGLAEQRVVEKVDLPDREIVRGAPPRVESLELRSVQGAGTCRRRGDRLLRHARHAPHANRRSRRSSLMSHAGYAKPGDRRRWYARPR